MASLIEELITTLSEEERLYKELIPIAEQKTESIVMNDLQSLNRITEQEQEFVVLISRLEKKRQEVIRNIGIVMNRKVEELNFRSIISMLEGQEKEQEELRRLHDRLRLTVERLNSVNERNQMLIKQTLEMIEFDINLVQSFRTAPSTAQYNQTSVVETQRNGKSIFDTRQ